jgi:outer membrane murein-binding lipoprotein Lpp
MKFLIILLVVGFIGINSQSSTDDSPITTPLGSSDTTPTTASNGNTDASIATDSPLSPPTTGAPEPTDAPFTGSTVEPVVTTLASTIAPTTTPPLKRDVQFNIDCSQKTQCSFAFKIAEPLMRYVNTTILDHVLTNLTSKITALSSTSSKVSNEENHYITALNTQINTLNSAVDNLNVKLNETISDAQELQENASNAATKAQQYLDSANCFRNDMQSSEACGAIAEISSA